MYGYSETLSKEEILQRYSQQDLVEKLITRGPVKVYERVRSPFREDKTPKAYFEWFGGKLWFVDFADTETHRDIFNMVCDLYQVSFMEALKIISQQKEIAPAEQKHTPIKQFHPITFRTREFQPRDAAFWKPYGISRQQLEGDGVYPVTWFRYYSHKSSTYMVIRPQDPAYAYTEFYPAIKIYRPYSKTMKWQSNCGAQDIGGWKHLLETGPVIISKSYKDWRVLTNSGVRNVVWLQGEWMKPELPPRDYIIWLDADDSGRKASLKLKDWILECKGSVLDTLFLPGPEKDPAEYYRQKGPEQLNFFLQKHQLL